MSEEQSVSTAKNKKVMFSGLRNISFGRSRAYLFEYGLLLILTLALLNILGMMFQELIGKQASFIQNAYYFPVFPYGFSDMTIGLFSTFLVVFPAVVILIQRTASAERVDPNIKNISWRKGLLNVFLAIACIWAIVGLVAVLSAVLNYLTLMDVTDATFDWREVAENLFRAVFLLLAVWAFSSDYRNTKSNDTPKVMHVYRYTLVGASVLAGVLFAVFPVRANGNHVIDSQISGDLYNIQSQINNKYYSEYILPSSLDDIDLNDAEKARAQEYSYKYERVELNKYKLCATFKSDTTNDYKEVFPVDAYLTYPAYDGDFNVHSKGEKCFELTVDDYGIYGDPEPFTMEATPTELDQKMYESETDPSNLEL